jgi:uncharacterized protein (TIGR02145 family)
MNRLLFILIVLSLSSCSKEFLNPYDPATPVDVWMPKAFKMDTLGANALRLSWKQDKLHIDGFAIQKTINGQIVEILLPLDSLSYTDTEVTQGSGIVTYKIRARAGNNRSDEIGTLQGIEVPISISFATLTTFPIGNLTSTSATCGGSISATGGSSVTQRGVCWSTSQNPTTASSSTNDGNGTGSFTSNLSGLIANTAYYVRAYAITGAGTAYGNQQSFTITTNGNGIVNSPGAGVTYNGYTYSSVVLGNGQEWMAENLRTTNYRNGDPIPTGLDDATWSTTTAGAYAIYSNDNANDVIYGKLYNWYAVADSRDVCPIGWHLPTDGEWTTLTDYLGGEAVAGGKMKTTGTQYWFNPNQDATNESGFSGLPGGARSASSGNSYDVGNAGYWWSSTESSTTGAWFRFVMYIHDNVNRTGSSRRHGFSVRCLRD